MRSLQTIVRRHRTSLLGVQQRVHPRYCVPSDTRGAIRSPWGDFCMPARLLNLSLSGAGLLLDEPSPVGELLHVEFSRTEPDFTCTMLLRVVHCTEQTDGRFLIGGRFEDELEPSELRMLIF